MGTKIKIVKPIVISEIGSMKLPVDQECEVSVEAAKVFIEKGFATEVKADKPKTATEVIDLIKAVVNIEDLKQFESDERATVKTALDEQKIKLTEVK